MKQDFNPKYVRRLKLVRLTRRAWEAWGEAAEELQERITDIERCEDCIRRAGARCLHRQLRYDRMERLLASATGMPRTSVYNAIARYDGSVPGLLCNL